MENTALRQHVLDLRRAVRAAGCDLSSSNVTFFPLPGLDSALGGAEAGPNASSRAASGPGAAAGEKGAAGGLQEDAASRAQLRGAAGATAVAAAGSDHAAAQAAVTGGKR